MMGKPAARFELLFILLCALLASHIHAAESATIDKKTDRNNMHSCPVDQFVVGFHEGKNQLLCEGGFGSYSVEDEETDKMVQSHGMLACQEGYGVTGIHVGKNKLVCTPLEMRPIRRLVDTFTERKGMHACSAKPKSVVVGIHVEKNLLLCAGDFPPHKEIIDTSTERNGMHSCPVGRFVVGHHANKNLLLCTSGFGSYTVDDEKTDRMTLSHDMVACQEGWGITGIHLNDTRWACARVAKPKPRQVDTSTQRQGMHACPPGLPISGIGRGGFLCGTQHELRINDFRESLISGNRWKLSWDVSCTAPDCIVGITSSDDFKAPHLRNRDFLEIGIDRDTLFTLSAESIGVSLKRKLRAGPRP